ncbi:MAG: hypothetical protein ABI629_05000 [bacterium]
MWFGVPDEALVPTVMRPAQFHDIWSRSAAISGERGLRLAVIDDALNDLIRYRFATRRRGQRLYWEAYTWVAADDRAWPFSFVNLCEGAGLSVDAIRQHVLNPMTPPLVSADELDSSREARLGKAA